MSDAAPSLRAAVQERARGRCEYCLMPGEYAVLSHELDHIIAVKHRGDTKEYNLAWSCYCCNRQKGSDIASIDIETGRIVRLFNPRTDNWDDHFRLEDAVIVPLTPEARVTEYLLRFNTPSNVRVRRGLISFGEYP